MQIPPDPLIQPGIRGTISKRLPNYNHLFTGGSRIKHKEGEFNKMEVCRYAVCVRDKDGRICYHCALKQLFIGLDFYQFCLECIEYAAYEEARGLKNA